MKKEINRDNLVTFSDYAKLHNYHVQWICQLVRDKRLKPVVIGKVKFLDKNVVIVNKKRGAKPNKALKVRHNGKLIYKSQLK